jgi:hypothetical protein
VQCEVWGRWWIGLLVARLGRVFTRNSEKSCNKRGCNWIILQLLIFRNLQWQLIGVSVAIFCNQFKIPLPNNAFSAHSDGA